jgi:uncharacterized membrane protein YphA (DoxX/SURF4 family)
MGLTLAALGTLVWTALDRRARPALHGWLRILLRYFLAMMMWSYGSVKVIQLQFPSPDDARLSQTLGDLSPMGLLWAMMGSSTAYTFFAGAAEILGGTLLLFRRTTTLGALILVGVMGNVVALNFCYDVPVKQFSTHLLAMAMMLALPDVRRLLDFFLLNREAAPAQTAPPFTAPRWRRIALVLKLAFLGYFLYAQTAYALREDEKRGEAVPPSALAGVYRVESVECASCPAWELVAIGRYKDEARWLFGHGDREGTVYRGKAVAQGFHLTLNRRVRESAPIIDHQLRVTLHPSDDGTLELRGHWRGQPFVVMLRRIDREFLLRERGFHWVNEYPLNL